MNRPLSWLQIIRIGLLQTAMGSVIVLAKATFNRVMVVELGLLAVTAGFLFGIYYAVQLARPWVGHSGDKGVRRTHWIIGGMAVLGLGAVTAALAIALMQTALIPGLVIASVSFFFIGLGSGAMGTSTLVLLSAQASPSRKPLAAMIVWTMMIMGFALTGFGAGELLDPFSFERMVWVVAGVAAVGFLVTCLSVYGIEWREPVAPPDAKPVQTPFKEALAQTWSDPTARLFTLFVFISMVGYSAQDLILEPYGGLVFGMDPGETTKLTGFQHSGALMGMIFTGVMGSLPMVARRLPFGIWAVLGCCASAVMLVALMLSGAAGSADLFTLLVIGLGFANGVFAVAAIGSMMILAGQGPQGRDGMRMGLWGAAQAMAMGGGELAGTIGVDAAHLAGGTALQAYGGVFAMEALLFAVAALLAWIIHRRMGVGTSRPGIGAISNHLVMEGQ